MLKKYCFAYLVINTATIAATATITKPQNPKISVTKSTESATKPSKVVVIEQPVSPSKTKNALAFVAQTTLSAAIYSYAYDLPLSISSNIMSLSNMSLLGWAIAENKKSRLGGGFYALFSGFNLSFGLASLLVAQRKPTFFNGIYTFTTGITSLSLASYLNRDHITENIGLSLISGSSFFLAVTALCLDQPINTTTFRKRLLFATTSATMLGSGIYLSTEWIKEHPVASSIAGVALAGLTTFFFFCGKNELHRRQTSNACYDI